MMSKLCWDILLDTFFWALTISWSRFLARVWSGPSIVWTIEPRTISKNWAHSPISFIHMSSEYPFWEAHLTTYHLDIGVRLRQVTELGMSTQLLGQPQPGRNLVKQPANNKWELVASIDGWKCTKPEVILSMQKLLQGSHCNHMGTKIGPTISCWCSHASRCVYKIMPSHSIILIVILNNNNNNNSIIITTPLCKLSLREPLTEQQINKCGGITGVYVLKTG